MEEKITVREAALLTGYTNEYVRQLARQGKINCDRFGRTLMIHKDSLLAYKQAHTKDQPKEE